MKRSFVWIGLDQVVLSSPVSINGFPSAGVCPMMDDHLNGVSITSLESSASRFERCRASPNPGPDMESEIRESKSL